MEKHLELTIEMDGDHFVVGIYEPESGEYAAVENNFSPDEHPEFDGEIGREIYSWLSLWFDELEDKEEINV